MDNKTCSGAIRITQGGQTLAVELYNDAINRDNLWCTWVDVATQKGGAAGTSVTVTDYRMDNAVLRRLTDKQAGFLLDGRTAHCSMTTERALYALHSGISPYAPQPVDRLIVQDPAAFHEFCATLDPMAAALNRLDHPADWDRVDIPRLKRMFQLKDSLTFFGAERIQHANDAAWLFRQLEDKAVENSFAVLTRGDQSVIIHLGIGAMNKTMVETYVIREAARRFGADKVWFVHNHPSGAVYASQEDIILYRRLKMLLGDALQPGIIINTNTGHYGVFTERTCRDISFLPEEGKDLIPIPVYAFDRLHFTSPGQSLYNFNSPEQVAEFLSTQRFGLRGKYAALVLTNNRQISGYFHLPYSDLSKVSASVLADRLGRLVIDAAGTGVVLLAKDRGQAFSLAQDIDGYMEQYFAEGAKLIDIIQVTSDNQLFRSYYSEVKDGTFIPSPQKKNPYMRVATPVVGLANDGGRQRVTDIQVRTFGESLAAKTCIRCRIDGNRTDYREITRAEANKWLHTVPDSTRTEFEYSLVQKYFQDELHPEKDRGIRR